MRHAIAVAVCLLSTIALAPAHAATRTWQGDVDTSWSTAGNWAENAAPVNGDDLVFPDNPASRNADNDIVGLAIASVTITTTNTGLPYNFTGNGITLNGQLSFSNPNSGSDGQPHWSIPLTLGGAVTITTSGRITWIEDAIALGANLLTLQGDGDLFISGNISDAGGLTKQSTSTLTLTGNNTYSGATQVNAGHLQTGNANALGASATGTTFADGTVLSVGFGPYTLAEPLTFSGPSGTVHMTGNNALGGALSFAGTLTFNMFESGSISGAITSTGTLVINGPNGLSTSTNSPAFTGTVLIQGGQFLPQNSLGAAITMTSGGLFTWATSGPLTMSGGTFAPGIGTQQFFAPAGLASSGGLHNLLMFPGDPVTDYDQLQVTGTVSLGGTTLNSTAAGTFALGETFVIILNDGVDPVAGTYVGKPEGATYFQANNWWQITYVGGDGNDVVLTTVAAPVAAPAVPVPGPGLLALALLALAIAGIAYRRR